jgi:hypothetical protein
MNDFDQLAQRYVTTWNEKDGDRRLRLVEELFATNASYVDPMASAQGTPAISGLIGAVQEQFPGYEFQLVGSTDGHHDQVRFRWGLASGEEEPVVIGFDVVQLGPSGRITQVLGFLDKVPAAAAA